MKTQENLPLFRGELALLLAVLVNSFGVVLMLYSGAGISAISSVPYAFSEVWPFFTLGTWTYLFQATLIASLMILRKRFVPMYLFSFVVGFFFSELLDIHKAWIGILPYIGIAFSNRCGLPIIPTDLFPRELAQITGISYPKIKISYDVICLLTTAILTFLFLGQIRGLGIGTIMAAFTMGKSIGMIGNILDRHFRFATAKDLKKA